MAQISNITLPDGTNYNLKGSIYTVIGTQTATTAAWTGVLDTVDALYDGLTIAYYLPRTSAANVTLNLTLKDETTTGAINCYYKTSTRLGTHYAAGDMVLMTYWSAGTISINGTATTDNRWIAHGQYVDGNSNTVPTAYSSTKASTAAKAATCTGYVLLNNSYIILNITTTNTANTPTLNINSTGAKSLYINGEPSSTTNKTMPAGTYLVFYDGTNYHLRTDGLIDGPLSEITYGTSETTSGTSISIPYLNVNSAGQIISGGTHTHTISGFLTSDSSLDASKLTGTVPTSVLPGSIDEIKEGYLYNNKFYEESSHTTEIEAAADKIYVDVSTNKTYRYGGSTAGYVEISASLALGNTASTAAKGNHTHTVTATGNVTTTTATTENKTATVSAASSGDATYTPAGTISVATAGTINNTLKPVTAKTVVTGATFNTVVTGGTTTDVPNISKKTVVTSASGATATVTNGTLTITNGSFSTGDSVTEGTVIKAYTTLNTGVSGSATTGDSVTLGSAVTVKTSDATYQFNGTGARLITGNIPVPATYTSTFSGTSATTNVPA